MRILKRKKWSPYVCGILIGLLQIPAFLIVGKTLGSSGGYGVFADYLIGLYSFEGVRGFFVNVAWWQFYMLFGVVFGAFLSSWLSKERKKGFSSFWKESLGIMTFRKRAIMAFCGGFLILLGARIADGCTSGHGISGIARLQVSSIIVISSMFVAAIITAQILYRQYKKRI